MSKETTLTSEMLYDGRIMKLYKDSVELENGKTSVREYIRHSGGASIMAVDAEENVYFVTQYRYPYAAEIFEIPAGKLEKGEAPLTCAERELEEEAGLKADKFELIATVYPTPSYTDEKLYVYLATGLTETAAHLDEGEFLGVEKMPFEKAYSMAVSGEIHDAKTLVAIYAYAARKARGELPRASR